MAACRAAGEFALDVVTNAPGGVQAELVGLAFSHADRQGAYLPVGHGGSGPADDLLSEPTTPVQVDRDDAIDALRPLLEDPARSHAGPRREAGR